MKHLLVTFMITSLFSAVANIFGRQCFAQSEWTILAAITPFSVMLFALSYIGFTRDFSFDQFAEDSSDSSELLPEDAVAMEENDIERNINACIIMRKLYLTPNLKIGDVAKATGICRTYISKHINRTKGVSFSDYINSLRVEHAKVLLAQKAGNTKIVTIATLSGFSSEQSFYRNFHKFTGMKPIEWTKQHLACNADTMRS